MAGRLEANGLAPPCNGFLPEEFRAQVNARLPRYQVLATNLTQMVTAAQTLWNDATYQPHFNDSTTTLAKRLVWSAGYFCIGLYRFAKWARTAPGSGPRNSSQPWADFWSAFGDLYIALLTVPVDWFDRAEHYLQDNDNTQQQQVPAEAPLELVVQMYLNVYDTAHTGPYPHGLISPDLVQDCLRVRLAQNGFVKSLRRNTLYGFSLCVFVSQSAAGAANRNLCAGSTIVLLDFDSNDEVFYNAFKRLRQLRFQQGHDNYAAELRNRFRDTSQDLVNADSATSPRARFESHGWSDNSRGLQVLEVLVTTVTTDLRNECLALPIGQRKVWHSFSYAGQDARSNFAAFTFPGQTTWFVPTPRCMKCRVIHDYAIANEDLAVQARANESCQCAEDICFGKFRQLNVVGNVTLADP